MTLSLVPYLTLFLSYALFRVDQVTPPKMQVEFRSEDPAPAQVRVEQTERGKLLTRLITGHRGGRVVARSHVGVSRRCFDVAVLGIQREQVAARDAELKLGDLVGKARQFEGLSAAARSEEHTSEIQSL